MWRDYVRHWDVNAETKVWLPTRRFKPPRAAALSDMILAIIAYVAPSAVQAHGGHAHHGHHVAATQPKAVPSATKAAVTARATPAVQVEVRIEASARRAGLAGAGAAATVLVWLDASGLDGHRFGREFGRRWPRVPRRLSR
jgi:hypothetical protein